MSVSVSNDVHSVNKGALGALEPSYTLKQLMKLEVEQESNRRENKVQEGEGEKSKKKPTILIVHGGIHYLHLYPVRGFHKLNGINLGHYKENMISTLNTLREYLGPDSLVIWATSGNICDARLEGEYDEVLKRLKKVMA